MKLKFYFCLLFLSFLSFSFLPLHAEESKTATILQLKTFLGAVLPPLYKIEQGKLSGLLEIKSVASSTVIANQEKAIEPVKAHLLKNSISQIAEIKAFNTDGIAINIDKNLIFIEAAGNITLVSKDNTTKTPVIWKCLVSIGKNSNPTGLFLEQISEETTESNN